MSQNIKSKETYYDGYRFRSRLEARWAVFFNNIGLEYEYEVEGFDMEECSYLPDFYIPSIDRWFEIKGQPLTVSEIQKCEQFCRRKDNENIKFSILIGAPKPLMLEEDFSILGIREYTWQWPSQMYPSDTLLLAQGLTREEYYSRFLPAIWKVDGVDDIHSKPRKDNYMKEKENKNCTINENGSIVVHNYSRRSGARPAGAASCKLSRMVLGFLEEKQPLFLSFPDTDRRQAAPACRRRH